MWYALPTKCQPRGFESLFKWIYLCWLPVGGSNKIEKSESNPKLRKTSSSLLVTFMIFYLFIYSFCHCVERTCLLCTTGEGEPCYKMLDSPLKWWKRVCSELHCRDFPCSTTVRVLPHVRFLWVRRAVTLGVKEEENQTLTSSTRRVILIIQTE